MNIWNPKILSLLKGKGPTQLNLINQIFMRSFTGDKEDWRNKHGSEPVSYTRLCSKVLCVVVQEKLVWCEAIFKRSFTGDKKTEEPSIESHSKLYYTVCEENSVVLC